jgi:hypothetical protein
VSLFSTEVPAWLRKPAAGFLSTEQKKMLDELFEGILPADPARQMPGAAETGASEFVSQLLAMGKETYWEIPVWQQLYTDALTALDQYAKNKYQKPLADLDGAQITEILARLEVGTLANLAPALDQKVLFNTLRRHCIQGCFADPRWGGNKDRIMWRAIGYLQPAEDFYHA